MSTREIIEEHDEAFWNQEGQKVCQCGFVYTEGFGSKFMLDHIAGKVEDYIREREFMVLLEARDRMVSSWPGALDDFEAGEVCDWLENMAYEIKDASNE